jgi:hypothetical protein
VTRIVSLSEAGRSPRVIASSVGLDEEFVRVVLVRAEAVAKLGRGRKLWHFVAASKPTAAAVGHKLLRIANGVLITIQAMSSSGA